MVKTKDIIHPAAYGVMLYMLVGIARLPELYPFLKPLFLGKLALIMAIIGLMKDKSGKSYNVSNEKLYKLVIFFAVLAVVSVAYSIWASYSLKFVIGRLLGIMLMFYIIIKTSNNEKAFKAYITTLIICAIILSIETLKLKGQGRLSVGSSYDPNDLAQVMCTIIPIAIVYSFTRKTKIKYVYFGITILLLFTILLTGSRGGLLGLFIVLPFILKSLIRDTKSLMKILAVAILGVTIGVSLAPDYTIERFNSMFNLEDDYNVTGEKGRLAIWGRGVDTMLSKPYGVGINAFSSAEGQAGGRHKAAHNAFIQVGVELGFVGLLVFIMLLKRSFGILNILIKKYKKSEEKDISDTHAIALALRASMLGYLITGMFLSCAYTPLLFCLFGLIAAMSLNENITATKRLPATSFNKKVYE